MPKKICLECSCPSDESPCARCYALQDDVRLPQLINVNLNEEDPFNPLVPVQLGWPLADPVI